MTYTEEVYRINLIEDEYVVSVEEDNYQTIETAPVILQIGLKNSSLIGAINNLNTDFTIAGLFLLGSTQVFQNGMKLINGIDYTEIDNQTIQFAEAPSNTDFVDKLEIIYKEL